MKILQYLLAICLVGFMPSATAVEPLSTADLLHQCSNHEKDPASLDTARCRSYLQGYMGGAYAMRTATITDSIPKKRSAFVERAQRTRMGSVDLRYGTNRSAGYCVPQELTISEFVARLNRFTKQGELYSELANQFVLNFLRIEFACKDADT